MDLAAHGEVDMELTTTLCLCRKARVCDEQYGLLARALGPGWGDDQPIPLTMLLDLDVPGWTATSNAIWALRATPTEQIERRDFVARLFAVGCVEAVLPIYERQHPGCFRPRYAMEVACQFAHGEATHDDLAAALAAAWAAAGAAAWDAARDAAWDAARAAAGDAQTALLRRLLEEASHA